jgi:hypothetical protein
MSRPPAVCIGLLKLPHDTIASHTCHARPTDRRVTCRSLYRGVLELSQKADEKCQALEEELAQACSKVKQVCGLGLAPEYRSCF